jgi:PPOX class probable F420-dependent enzyme
VKERERVSMTPEEVTDLLAKARKVQIATINRDGSPHLVAMFYALVDGRIAFWTYRASQKARNLARDPRLTCLVEDGEDYFELRGVQVAGVVRRIDDTPAVAQVGQLIAARLTGVPAGTVDDYVLQAARKRAAYFVEPERITSWDHRKLIT